MLGFISKAQIHYYCLSCFFRLKAEEASIVALTIADASILSLIKYFVQTQTTAGYFTIVPEAQHDMKCVHCEES